MNNHSPIPSHSPNISGSTGSESRYPLSQLETEPLSAPFSESNLFTAPGLNARTVSSCWMCVGLDCTPVSVSVSGAMFPGSGTVAFLSPANKLWTTWTSHDPRVGRGQNYAL